MNFNKALTYLQPKPNGTYDLVAYVNAHGRTVRFEWGNSLRISSAFDKETNELEEIVGRVFRDVHPERIKELMLLPTTKVFGEP